MAVMRILERHLRENLAGWVQFFRGVTPEKVPSKLAAVGVVTCGAAMGGVAAASPPAGWVTRVWLGALAGAFFAGICVIWAAIWVNVDAPRRYFAGQIILCASLVPLAVAIGLSGSDDPELIFNVVFGALVS